MEIHYLEYNVFNKGYKSNASSLSPCASWVIGDLSCIITWYNVSTSIDSAPLPHRYNNNDGDDDEHGHNESLHCETLTICKALCWKGKKKSHLVFTTIL